MMSSRSARGLWIAWIHFHCWACYASLAESRNLGDVRHVRLGKPQAHALVALRGLYLFAGDV